MKFHPRLLLLILPILWALALFDFAFFTGGDNAYYLILSKSIAFHHSYTDLFLPGTPSATHFPPLLPLILSPFVFIFGHNYIPEKFVVLFFFGVSVVFCFLVLQKVLGVKSRSTTPGIDLVILVFAYAFNFVAVEHSHHILSEIPYLAFSLISIFFLMNYLENKRRCLLFLTIFTAVLTFHLRTIGFTLILAEFLVLLRRDRKALPIAVGLAILLVIPWSLRNFFVSGSTSNYLQQFLLKNVYAADLGTITFGDFLGRIQNNSFRFASQIYCELMTSKNPGLLISIPLLLLTMVGVVEGLKGSKSEVMIWYLLLYNIFMLSWHWYDSRYALPVLPFFLYSIYLGSKKVSSYIKKGRFPIPAVLLLLLFFSNVHSGSKHLSPRWRGNQVWLSGDRLYPYPKGFRNYFEVAQFAEANTAENAIVCARKPRLFYWFSERKSIVYPYTSDTKKMRDFFDENQIQYVVLDTIYGTTKAYLMPALNRMRSELRLVYETPTFPKVYLLEIVH
ncbi:hypothetical protein E3J38_07075 [candidate division TA06 bacterium]|uniref:Glycosyltransferase RgtA/B/C/D-like domain-containing protein n=1 Tax=candidate division TA06 bacterium TaxID=2250710 RepID=A0A523XJR0_UNCT6|nr:MAG: hypothetical protein E3J38_07075 [candidate division TA06 bacterium]